MLAAMARYTENYVGSLPNFLCELTTEQYLSGTKHEKWKRGDTLVAQLTYSNGKEKRLLEAINDKPVKGSAARLRRPLTTEGEFGSILVDVFADSTNAKIDWNRWDTIQGKKVAVFDYAVDKEHSLLRLSRSDLATALVAYHGSVFGDLETGAILRVTNQADDIPPEIQILLIATTVDYEETRIGSSVYLLPSHASVLDNATTAHIRNELFFRNYRKFEAESTIKFGDERAPDPAH
jgi:hypothetical protein